MDLAALHTRPDCFNGNTLAVVPIGKGVPRLVGDDLDIMLSAVEICKDKRNFVIVNTRAVTAAVLTLGREDIHKLIIEHHSEKFTRFG